MSKYSLVKIILTALLVGAGSLVGLKLFGVIGWSWSWVLAPWWVSVGILLVLFVMLAWYRRSL